MEDIQNKNRIEHIQKHKTTFNQQFPESIQLFLLKAELIEAGIYNDNLLRIRWSLEWRLSRERERKEMENQRNMDLNENFVKLEELFHRTQNIQGRLRRRLERAELEVIDLRNIRPKLIGEGRRSYFVNSVEGRKNRGSAVITTRFIPRMSMREGNISLGRRSSRRDFQIRRESRMPGSRLSIPLPLLPSRLTEPGRLDGELPIIPENSIIQEEAKTPLDASNKFTNVFGGGERGNKKGEIWTPNIQSAGQLSAMNYSSNSRISADCIVPGMANALRNHDMSTLEEKVGELGDMLNLQKDRADQMKNAYLNARQQIDVLNRTILHNQNIANTQLLNATQSNQKIFNEMKVYIDIYTVFRQIMIKY